MYDYIKGTLTYTDIDHVVVEAGGIGYRIFCGNPSALRVNEDRQIMLYLHHHVREDLQVLYGFQTREERRMFRFLLEVSGIGPKGASAIIANSTPQQIALAIAQEDVKFLKRFPGIGEKTAKRVIIDLKDKLKTEGFSRDPGLFNSSAGPHQHQPEDAQNLLEALEALLVLGFQEREALPLLQEIHKDNPGLPAEQLIRQVLAMLQRF